MSWSSRETSVGALAFGVMLAVAPAPAAADVTPQIAVGGRVTAASNPFLLLGGTSAVLVEGSIEPSLTIDRADGSELAFEGVLTAREYSRAYGGYVLGSATATGVLRHSERLSVTGLASYDRDIAADTITEGIGSAAGPRSIRNAVRGRAAATWRPNAHDTLTPQLDYERVSYEDSPLLQTVVALSADLGYSRRLSERTSIGARAVVRHSRTAGEGIIITLAAFATGDQRLSPVWRLSGDIGVERIELSGDLAPGVQRTRTNLSGRGRLCADGERLTGCLDVAAASEASPLGGVQRRYTLGATTSWQTSERWRIEAVVEYSKAESGRQSTAPELGGALARVQVAWNASRRVVVTGEIEYRRRDFGVGPVADGVFAGVGLRWGTR